MKQNRLNLLLFVLIAACAVFAVSCGATSDTIQSSKFLFIEIDKEDSGAAFFASGIIMLVYWVIRLLCKNLLPDYSYEQLLDILQMHGERELKTKETSVSMAFFNYIRIGHLVARLTPVMMFWSWFIDSVEREFLYWILVILTSAALRYGTELLGINMWDFRKKWIVIWSIISVVGYVICLL